MDPPERIFGEPEFQVFSKPATLKIFSIIVHFNTPHEVIQLTHELLDCPIPEHTILIVDNQSEQIALQKLQTVLGHKEAVVILPQQKNGGFGYGVNRAAEWISQSESTAFLHIINSDARIVNQHYLTVLSDFLISHPDVAMAGPRVREQDGKTIQNTILPLTTVSGVLTFRKKYSLENKSAAASLPLQVDCLNGVCFLIRLADFQQAGGFDEAYFMYNEEQDLCIKLRKNNREIYFIPVDSIQHEGGNLLMGEKPDWRFLYKRRNIVLFLKKHQSRTAAILIAGIFSLTSIPKFIRTPGTLKWTTFVKAVWSVV